jgi:hypothetical protein
MSNSKHPSRPVAEEPTAPTAPTEETKMNKTSMDALNRGWSIGFGTQIHPSNPDFDYALSRADAQVAETPRAPSLAQLAAGYTDAVAALFATLRRRPAH